MNQNIIEVHHLSKSFGQHCVVDNISLSVKKGEVFGFLGPNGSGKTTTIRMLCGLLTPDKGEGTCLGFDVLRESKKIKQEVGYMTQRFSLYGDLSVEENLNFIAGVYGVTPKEERVAETLLDMELQSRRKQLAGTLSGGWKQRLALAAALLHKPKLLLLDEPTAGVDPIARREFWDKIHELSEKGVSTLVSTHYMDEAERCTRLAYLAYGQLIITGTVEEIIAATKLLTWDVNAQISSRFLMQIKNLPGVTQSALFGSQVHVCGYDKKLIEQGLSKLRAKSSLQWQPIPTTLEDAFISLVKQYQEK